MKPEELRELADDIAANGLRDPVTLTPGGLLLDGRNRALACEMAGVEPATTSFNGDPWLFSLSRAALTPDSAVGSLSHETPVTAAEVSYGASSDAKAESEALQPAPPSPGSQIATPTPDEICKRDGDRLTQLHSSATSHVALATKPTSGTHRTASLLKGRPKAYASACASGAACFWRGRERLFAVNHGRKLFALFPLKVFSGPNIASR